MSDSSGVHHEVAAFLGSLLARGGSLFSAPSTNGSGATTVEGLALGAEAWLEAARAWDKSVLQPVWDLRKLGNTEDYLRSPLFPVVMSVSFYFAVCTPFTLMDTWLADWRWLQKYKIQPRKRVTWREVRTAFLLNVWNNVVIILPAALGQFVWVPDTPLGPQAPALSQFLWHILASSIIFDLEYFLWHWLHHKVPILYKRYHEFHHQYHSPSSWVTQYLHPWELLCVGTWVTTTPWMLGAHPMTEWSFHLLSIWLSVEAHIGYDFPWLPANWVPGNFLGGAPKHDMHHMRPTTNYQPWFNTFDRVFRTSHQVVRAGGLTDEEYARLSTWQKLFGC